MVSDRSPDFEETWGFLDRRMSDIGTLITAKKSVSEVFFFYLVHTARIETSVLLQFNALLQYKYLTSNTY